MCIILFSKAAELTVMFACLPVKRNSLEPSLYAVLSRSIDFTTLVGTMMRRDCIRNFVFESCRISDPVKHSRVEAKTSRRVITKLMLKLPGMLTSQTGVIYISRSLKPKCQSEQRSKLEIYRKCVELSGSLVEMPVTGSYVLAIFRSYAQHGWLLLLTLPSLRSFLITFIRVFIMHRKGTVSKYIAIEPI